ncbi:MAG: hypothetical protein KF733_03605 [Fimbriimonadaceae bacterium]|nr:MAG: hypothetical protein KF733_03605 [Fimbriimonadaceae bacterium]
MVVQLYEALGLRGYYRLISRIAGEEPLPPSNQIQAGVSRERLTEIIEASRYFQSANVARAFCYLPHIVIFWLNTMVFALAYTWLLVGLHLMTVFNEAYKRRLASMHLALAEDEPETKKPEVGHYRGLADLYFRPKSFETERFYQMLGMEHYRSFVQWVMRTLTHGFSGKRMVYIPQPTRAHAVEFERGTRVSEGVHLVGVGLTAPLLWFCYAGAPLGLSLWSSFITLGDMGLAVLQRYHRTRVWPVVARVRKRKGAA